MGLRDKFTPGKFLEMELSQCVEKACTPGYAGTETHLARIRELLGEGVSPNATQGGFSLLAMAAKGGQEGYGARITQVLIDAKADVNLKVNGNTALDVASALGHWGAATVLLNAQAKISGPGSDGRDALASAAMAGADANMIHALVGAGGNVQAKVGSDPLITAAAQAGHFEAVNALVQAGAAGSLSATDAANLVAILTKAEVQTRTNLNVGPEAMVERIEAHESPESSQKKIDANMARLDGVIGQARNSDAFEAYFESKQDFTSEVSQWRKSQAALAAVEEAVGPHIAILPEGNVGAKLTQRRAASAPSPTPNRPTAPSM